MTRKKETPVNIEVMRVWCPSGCVEFLAFNKAYENAPCRKCGEEAQTEHAGTLFITIEELEEGLQVLKEADQARRN